MTQENGPVPLAPPTPPFTLRTPPSRPGYGGWGGTVIPDEILNYTEKGKTHLGAFPQTRHALDGNAATPGSHGRVRMSQRKRRQNE